MQPWESCLVYPCSNLRPSASYLRCAESGRSSLVATKIRRTNITGRVVFELGCYSSWTCKKTRAHFNYIQSLSPWISTYESQRMACTAVDISVVVLESRKYDAVMGRRERPTLSLLCWSAVGMTLRLANCLLFVELVHGW